MDFEAFHPDLERALAYSTGAQGSRPPYDPVLMLKILVIQAANGLSDERAEFLISDRLSFMRFLGLGLSDRVPDARTIRLFRERLTRAGAIEPLFARFEAMLRGATSRWPGRSSIPAWSRLLASAIRRRRSRRSRPGASLRPGRGGRLNCGTRIVTRAGRSTEGPRSEFHQGQAAGGWHATAGRHRDPGLWLSEPCRDRP